MFKQLSAPTLGEMPEDAMLTKKYVGPADCASCEKGIVNLNGMRAEHLVWNRLPFREPNERLAKVSNLKLNFSTAKDLVDFCKLLDNKIIKRLFKCKARPETLAKLNFLYTHKENKSLMSLPTKIKLSLHLVGLSINLVQLLNQQQCKDECRHI
jgi:hypothetical protein